MWHQIPICLEWDKEDEIWIRARSPSIQLRTQRHPNSSAFHSSKNRELPAFIATQAPPRRRRRRKQMQDNDWMVEGQPSDENGRHSCPFFPILHEMITNPIPSEILYLQYN